MKKEKNDVLADADQHQGITAGAQHAGGDGGTRKTIDKYGYVYSYKKLQPTKSSGRPEFYYK